MEFYHEKKLDNIDYVSRIQPKILNHQTISYLISYLITRKLVINMIDFNNIAKRLFFITPLLCLF